jgi:type I restriction enzyme S subunit
MKWDVDLPGIDEQRRIGQMLKNIDDKIAINNRINHNLEEQAQALYKSWFVNFEPFKGGKFIDSELGMIPEGWRVGRIADMVADTYNGDWGKDELTGPYTKRVLCIRGADIPSLRVGSSGKMPIRFIQDKHFQSKFLKDGDIVVEISGGSPTQSTGRYCRISDSLINRYGNSLICTNFCKAVRPLGGYSFFLSLLWDHLYDNGVMFSYENGTTGIKNLDLAGLLAGEPVLIPCFDIVQSFSKMISSLNHKVLFNGLENELLAAQRDTLLPKLMSGTTKLTN